MSEIHLPEKIRIHVFGFLSDRDKLNVRLSCTYFETDRPLVLIWKDSVIVLQKFYDSHFWKILRQNQLYCRSKATAKVLQQIVTLLPWIGSVRRWHSSDDTHWGLYNTSRGSSSVSELLSESDQLPLSLRQLTVRSREPRYQR